MFLRKLAALSCALMVLLTASCAFAGSGDNSNTVRVLFDGEEVNFRVAPQFYHNRLVVPVRPLLETLGAQVAWDREKNTLSTSWEGKKITLHINQSMIELNGNIVESHMPAVIVGGTTMMPLGTFSELFGVVVKWDGENNVVELGSKNYIPFQRIKEGDDLPAVVRQWVEDTSPEKADTTLAFGNHLYVLSSLGRKPTMGYSVRITRIVGEHDSLRISVERREPLPGHSTIQVISHPYDLICLDLQAMEKPVKIIFQPVNP